MGDRISVIANRMTGRKKKHLLFFASACEPLLNICLLLLSCMLFSIEKEISFNHFAGGRNRGFI